MPSFSNSLEELLHRALEYANERHHEFATLEHLLLSLIDDRDASSVMRACNVDLDRLRVKLADFIDKELSNLILDEVVDARPVASFERVIHRAVVHVQSSGREEVTGAHVLLAFFAERESNATFFLTEQDMTRFDAVNFISHGIYKRADFSQTGSTLRVQQESARVNESAADTSTGGQKHGLSGATPSFSPILEKTLHRAFEYANERHHEYATPEHLLLSLIEDRDAASVMRACKVDLDQLRAKLTDFVDKELSNLILDQDGEAQPTASFQRIIHRAVMYVTSSGAGR